ncbi:MULTISPECIES: hypothetical protein [Sulfitobacter]|jgi:hypothetical protein|uniref:Uncharacterized protein n=1 Tax=Sulfitobacter dubius TaxID=218673 RepID=A0ABY3ZI16_9RHOB|nr:hypothetical protein [Sulfitobacter dubius]UOA13785.1 hypothetical protein DSM109990_00578 [Sulfitobacter dubius]WOI27710.1 hypothetical protein R1T39_08300 [Sulfitobacter dubius]
MKNSQRCASETSDEVQKPYKPPTETDLVEIRSLYAQADAMAEAAEESPQCCGEGETPHSASPPMSSQQGDERGDTD